MQGHKKSPIPLSDEKLVEKIKENKNMSKQKDHLEFGKVIVLGWIVASFIFTWLILDKITPEDVYLGDYSCGKATYGECVEEEIKPRTANEISNNLTQIIKDIKKVNLVLQLPLKIIEFEMVFVDRGSQLQLEISEPKYKTSLLPELDLRCNFANKEFPLHTNGRHYTKEHLQLSNLEEEDVEDVAERIANSFNGCEWYPKNDIHIAQKIQKEVAPNAVVKVNKVIKPYLTFQKDLLGKTIIFFVWFAIIGGIIALIKQTVQVWRKGRNYFLE